MDVTANYLRERYGSLSTDELLEIAQRGELTSVARNEMASVLADRGVDLNDVIQKRKRATAEPAVTNWALVTKKFPRTSYGYVIAILYFVGGTFLFYEHPELDDVVRVPLSIRAYQLTGWFVGYGYWLFCLHRVHWIVAEATKGTYPISPARAAGFHFIPIFNLYWVFRWPDQLGIFLRDNHQRTSVGEWLGLPIISGFATARFADAAVGLVVLFGVTSYVVRALRRTQIEFEQKQNR